MSDRWARSSLAPCTTTSTASSCPTWPARPASCPSPHSPTPPSASPLYAKPPNANDSTQSKAQTASGAARARLSTTTGGARVAGAPGADQRPSQASHGSRQKRIVIRYAPVPRHDHFPTRGPPRLPSSHRDPRRSTLDRTWGQLGENQPPPARPNTNQRASVVDNERRSGGFRCLKDVCGAITVPSTPPTPSTASSQRGWVCCGVITSRTTR